MGPNNGAQFRPPQNNDPAMLRPITCKCGSEAFDQVQRAFLKFERLRPTAGMAITPSVAFKCSACGEFLNAAVRIKEIIE